MDLAGMSGTGILAADDVRVDHMASIGSSLEN